MKYALLFLFVWGCSNPDSSQKQEEPAIIAAKRKDMYLSIVKNAEVFQEDIEKAKKIASEIAIMANRSASNKNIEIARTKGSSDKSFCKRFSNSKKYLQSCNRNL